MEHIHTTCVCVCANIYPSTSQPGYTGCQVMFPACGVFVYSDEVNTFDEIIMLKLNLKETKHMRLEFLENHVYNSI